MTMDTPANITGSGILVVHNQYCNAGINNVTGTFTGLIISDDIYHIQGTIIGGVIALMPIPSTGNCISTGNGTILFSSAAISGSSDAAGVGGSSASRVIGWYE